MTIHRLLYRSDAVERQLAEIVEASRTSNEAAGLTGALLLSSGVFIQALEGPLDAIESTFERICGDLRHKRVRLLELAVAEERVFGEWSTGQVTPSRELARLCPSLGTTDKVRLDAAKASAVIQLMRTRLLTGIRPSGPAQTRIA